jgi:hypothetical protein
VQQEKAKVEPEPEPEPAEDPSDDDDQVWGDGYSYRRYSPTPSSRCGTCGLASN